MIACGWHRDYEYGRREGCQRGSRDHKTYDGLERRVVRHTGTRGSHSHRYYAISMKVQQTRRTTPMPEIPLYRNGLRAVCKRSWRGTSRCRPRRCPDKWLPVCRCSCEDRRDAKQQSTAEGGSVGFLSWALHFLSTACVWNRRLAQCLCCWFDIIFLRPLRDSFFPTLVVAR